ncbi:MAG: hypothetical protein AAF741_17040 [Bacteroidota bacterium]
MSQPDYAKVIALFAAALLLFNFPLIDLPGKSSFLGIPTQLFYLFAAWLIVIILVLRMYSRRRSSR